MSPGAPILSSAGLRVVADGDGDRILHELVMDYLIKGAIVIVALVVLCIVPAIVYLRAGR